MILSFISVSSYHDKETWVLMSILPTCRQSNSHYCLYQEISPLIDFLKLPRKLHYIVTYLVIILFLIVLLFAQLAMLAKQCVDEDPILRPDMKQVVISLSQILLSSVEWEATLAGNSQVFSGLVQGRQCIVEQVSFQPTYYFWCILFFSLFSFWPTYPY